MGLDVCYVVNSVSETSVPATLGVALARYEDIDVDILAWFEAEPFEGDESVGVDCLDAHGAGLDPQTYRAAREKLRGYDIVQAHTNHSGSVAKLIGHELGTPLVSREGNTRNGFSRKGRIANGLTNRLADRIVPNSQAVYDSFTSWERLLVDEDKVEIIPNGVDIERIDACTDEGLAVRDRFEIPPDAFLVGTAAVISRQKALDVFVEGVHRASGQVERPIHAVIAGDGSHRGEIACLVSDLGIDDRIHFTGMVDRRTVYQLLGDLDLYAMPSRWEGFSMAAVEALGSATSCLFSDIDPFLKPYRNVARFHAVDDTADFAEQLVTLLRNPDLREFYAASGRELVEQEYTLADVAQRYATLYNEVRRL